MKSFKITGLVLAGLSFFNVCSAQDLLKGSVDGKTISMTMDPFAVNEAIQQNTADISSLLAPATAYAYGGNGKAMLKSLDIGRLDYLEADTVHFYLDNLSSLFPEEDHLLVGLTSGVYTAELTATIESTSSLAADTTYTGFIGLATSGDMSEDGGPENLEARTRLAPYSLGADSTIFISQTSLLYIPDSSAIAPLLLKLDDLEDVTPEAPGGNQEVGLVGTILKIVRLGDFSELEIIFAD